MGQDNTNEMGAPTTILPPIDETVSKVRAKFKVLSVNKKDDDMINVEMWPVTACDDPSNENNLYWKWTPAGRVELISVNEQVGKFFQVGKEYYLDFVPAN